MSRGVWMAACGLVVWAVALGGCVEERIVSARGGLYGIEGAQTGLGEAASRRPPSGLTLEAIVDEFHGGRDQLEIGEPIEHRPNRRRLADGSVFLISRSPSDLIRHLFDTVVDAEWDLLYDQLIAEETKDAYRQANRDPRDAVEFIREHRVDFVALLRLMGRGEHSAGVRYRPIASNAFRLHAEDAREFGRRFSTMDIRIENGRFVLLTVR